MTDSATMIDPRCYEEIVMCCECIFWNEPCPCGCGFALCGLDGWWREAQETCERGRYEAPSGR